MWDKLKTAGKTFSWWAAGPGATVLVFALTWAVSSFGHAVPALVAGGLVSVALTQRDPDSAVK